RRAGIVLDILGDSADVRLTRAVQDEVQDKQDEVAARVAKLAATIPPIVDHAQSVRVDPPRALGRGERSVLTYALATGAGVLCVLAAAAPLLRRAVEAGLYLDDATLRRVLTA